jgi:hypothetical protein
MRRRRPRRRAGPQAIEPGMAAIHRRPTRDFVNAPIPQRRRAIRTRRPELAGRARRGGCGAGRSRFARPLCNRRIDIPSIRWRRCRPATPTSAPSLLSRLDVPMLPRALAARSAGRRRGGGHRPQQAPESRARLRRGTR